MSGFTHGEPILIIEYLWKVFIKLTRKAGLKSVFSLKKRALFK